MYKKLDEDIAEFRERIRTDGTEFCHGLFEWSTLRLLAHKYAYYVMSDSYVKDITYDLEERDWYVMGRALDILKEDEISPCVDFDFKHRMANDAVTLSNYLRAKENPEAADEVCQRYDPCY